MLTFGLDFDDTFTACPEIFTRFINELESSGHRVILVTARRDTNDNNALIRSTLKEHGLVLPIVFSSLGSKLDAVKKRGIDISIWIDDEPFKLVHGH